MKFSKHLLVMLISYSALSAADSEIKNGMYLRAGDGGVLNVFLIIMETRYLELGR